MVGEGTIGGGLFVMRPGAAGVEMMHVESDFGFLPEHAKVLEAAKRAAGLPGSPRIGVLMDGDEGEEVTGSPPPPQMDLQHPKHKNMF